MSRDRRKFCIIKRKPLSGANKNKVKNTCRAKAKQMNIKTIKENGMECKKCGSTKLVKGGFSPDGTQRYLCSDCGSRQVFSHREAGRPQKSHPRVKCVNCGSSHLVKNGKNRLGNQLWKCKDCGTRGTFSNNFQE